MNKFSISLWFYMLHISCALPSGALTEDNVIDFCESNPEQPYCLPPKLTVPEKRIDLTSGGKIQIFTNRIVGFYSDVLTAKIVEGTKQVDLTVVKIEGTNFSISMIPEQLQNFQKGTAQLTVTYYFIRGVRAPVDTSFDLALD